MALQTIFDAVRAFLPAEIGMEVGPEHLGDHTAPPCIVWVPTEDRFVPIQQHGPALPPAQRIIAQDEQHVEAHCWGEDWDEAEDLKQAAITAMRLAVGTSARPVSGRWPQRADAIAQGGRNYVLTFAIQLSVTLPPGVADGEAVVLSEGPHDVAPIGG